MAYLLKKKNKKRFLFTVFRKFEVNGLSHYNRLLDDTNNFTDESDTLDDKGWNKLGTILESSQSEKPPKSFELNNVFGHSRRFAICEELERSIYITPKTSLHKCRHVLVVKNAVDGMLF